MRKCIDAAIQDDDYLYVIIKICLRRGDLSRRLLGREVAARENRSANAKWSRVQLPEPDHFWGGADWEFGCIFESGTTSSSMHATIAALHRGSFHLPWNRKFLFWRKLFDSIDA